MIMIGILVATAILWVILALVAGKEGETSYSTRFYVSLGVTFASFVVGLCQPELTIFVTPVICVLAVQKFCYIGWPRSIVATVLYMGATIASGLLLHSLLNSLNN
jgi:hypothetical protein